MSEKLYVKPVNAGALLRDPVTKRVLPSEGGFVQPTAFWRRRVRNGDVVLADPPKSAARVAPERAAPVAPIQTRDTSDSDAVGKGKSSNKSRTAESKKD